jgi:hypothetical protein
MTRNALQKSLNEIFGHRRPKVGAGVMRDRALGGGALRKAQTLADAHGVKVEKEGPGAYWVTHPDLDGTPEDPCEGNHFCTDGREVLETVQAYADHFTTTKKDTP